ncbi:isochorismatase family protein [Variovorax sp. CCNWLW225]|uniref:isochorismatase family protein n=1 Tax=Variovorax sp. CCNWLW225 TaxID=3127462 RepID=UPI003077F9F8
MKSGQTEAEFATKSDSRCAVAAQAVLVVDVQFGFVKGPEAVPGSTALLPALESLLARARVANASVIFLQNDGPPGAVDEPDTAGWQLYFVPQEGDQVVRKSEDDGFMGTELHTLLKAKGIQNIAICGVLSEMCVAATARSAMQRGYGVILPRDGHATYDVPSGPGGSPPVPAALAARAAEWSLGDEILIVPSVAEVVFENFR